VPPPADSSSDTYDGLDRKIAHNDGPFGEESGEHHDGLNTTLLTDGTTRVAMRRQTEAATRPRGSTRWSARRAA
jgi:hypothetical protein